MKNTPVDEKKNAIKISLAQRSCKQQIMFIDFIKNKK